MDKYEIIHRIEKIAPLETAEKWDCSGWIIESDKTNIKKIMLALTVTDNVVQQAQNVNCDLIISHHPLFKVPIKYKDIDIYCAHTNMDIAKHGTTDTLIKKIISEGLQAKIINNNEGFVRYLETEINIKELLKILYRISKNLRFSDKGTQTFRKIALCAGSGSEFIEEAADNGADGFITGDLKFHTALDSPITIFDIGHFESEIQVLKVFENIIGEDCEIIYAKEISPITNYNMQAY